MKDFPPGRGKGFFTSQWFLNGDYVDQMQGGEIICVDQQGWVEMQIIMSQRLKLPLGGALRPLGHHGAQWKAFAPSVLRL